MEDWRLEVTGGETADSERWGVTAVLEDNDKM